MNQPAKKYYFCLIFLFISAFCFAQTSAATEEKELYFDIYYTYKVHDTIIVFINGAQNFGLKKGTLVNAYQSYTSSSDPALPSRKFNFIGGGKIEKADTLVAANIKLTNEEDTLIEGDLVSIKLNIPVVEQRSIFSELAFNKILFNTLNRQSFYGLNNILNIDNKQKYQAEIIFFCGLVQVLRLRFFNNKANANYSDFFGFYTGYVGPCCCLPLFFIKQIIQHSLKRLHIVSCNFFLKYAF